jgi:predicted DNA-binding protein with PD1-like motif
MELWPLRLKPGEDLRRALEALVQNAVPAFVVAGIGSLGQGHLRFAGVASETVVDGPLEILTLSGTLGEGGAHLHMSVSDAAGRVHGGHVAYGNVVRTTAEVLLVQLPGWSLAREPDPITGFKELRVRRQA